MALQIVEKSCWHDVIDKQPDNSAIIRPEFEGILHNRYLNYQLRTYIYVNPKAYLGKS